MYTYKFPLSIIRELKGYLFWPRYLRKTNCIFTIHTSKFAAWFWIFFVFIHIPCKYGSRCICPRIFYICSIETL